MGLVAGELDQRLIFETKTENQDVFGYKALTWATHTTLWGSFVQKDGSERGDDNNRNTKRMVTFKTRYVSSITNEMRIKWNDEWYKIEDIKEIRRQAGLLIMATLLAQT